jgi:LacI family transcriptional regulator
MPLVFADLDDLAMSDIQQIALAFPRGAHQEMLIDGVLQYARENGCRWTFITAPESLSLSILDLQNRCGDGVIAALNTPEEIECAKRINRPMVNISSATAESPVPRVNIDNRLLGEMAADHLIQRGFSNFAYYGLTRVGYSQLRQEGFETRLQAAGFRCTTLLAEPTFGLQELHWQEQHQALAEWLRSLAPPVALFAVSDYRARQVLDVCREIGITVPQDVAVLGVDNEEVICQHIQPQLSSIARNDQLEGYQAAAVLHRLLQGQEASEFTSVPPAGIVERESTRVIAVSDSRIREAINYIFKHIEHPFGVQELAIHVGVSRRWLEYSFRETVGESPYKYIRRQQLEHARRLLGENPSTKIYQIAQRTGFNSAKRFMTAFRQSFGMSPREYRRSVHGEPARPQS